MGLLVGGFAVLPGRAVPPSVLRAEYARQLQGYAGTRYLWGGESRRGIDCSGLIRRGMIDANLHIAFVTLNPRALRSALDLWWHDCSARALRDAYRGQTQPIQQADSINALARDRLQTGDIAVTADGLHVLAYLGNDEWIQAEPGVKKVIILRSPNENVWFNKPVHVMRWASTVDTSTVQ
ncbi:MAG: C40 family peptidase [Phycisphaerales bacterium]|nr:C40 family peptidase [Phycisphaerales bacterium]